MTGRRFIGAALVVLLGGCSRCGCDGDDRFAGVTVPEQTAGWSVEPSVTGQAVVRFNHATAIEYSYGFFGPAWNWAAPKVHPGEPTDDGGVSFTVDVEKLGLKIDGTMKEADARTLEVTWTVNASQTKTGIEGGGIDFRLRPNATLMKRGVKKPELLPDNKGYRWPVGADEEVEVTFDGPMHSVYFEKGRPEAIRAFFVGDTIKPGTSTTTMRIKLPESGAVMKPLGHRYGLVDPKTWRPGVLSWDGVPVDLSHLNASDRPAGQHGPVRSQGDALVFEDGTPARFWGANVAGGALVFAEPEAVRAQAKRLAAFGFNLVRIHHHDAWWLRPNVLDPAGGLNTEVLGKIDWWVKCLHDEGIYTWIDIHVGRAFTDKDAITGYSELKTQKNEGRGFNYVNPSIETRMAEFAKAYFDRTNAHTGIRYVDDPAVIGVLVTNENDLGYHGVRFFNPGAGGAPLHMGLLRKMARPIAGELGLPDRAAQAFNQPGQPKVLLAEIEARWNRRAVDQIRGFGWKGPIATTNYWGKSPLHVLPPTLVGDIVDTHSYGDAEFLRKSPFFEPNFVTWLAAGQLAGMPMSVTEWNVPWPARDRFIAPLYLSSLAALQEWDAVTFYVYSQHPIPPPQEPTKWSSLQDPAMMAMMPASALIFREQHVSAAKKTIRLELKRDELYGAPTSPSTSLALRTITEQSRLEIGLPNLPELSWDEPRSGRDGAEVVTDPNKAFLDTAATSVSSDTGQLRRDWATEIHTIDTARTQAAQGWIGGENLALQDVEFRVTTPKAAVAVSSLDGAPIRDSKRLLVSVIAQVAPSPGNAFPLLSQPIEGEIRIRNGAAKLQIVPLYAGADGDATPTASTKDGEQHVIPLPNQPTHWFELRP